MKIALISDIHFGKDSRTKEFSVPGEEVFDETTGAVSLEQGLIDVLKANEAEYLFIAGDLTSVGSPQEYYYCEKKMLEIAKKSNISKDNIVCSLGNHDIDWTVSNLHEIQCKDKASMIYKLKEIVLDFVEVGDIVLVPDGPKPLIMAMSLIPEIVGRPGISCLHVSRNKKFFKPIDVEAIDSVIGFSVMN